ncbi:LysE family translocator [Acinetobacter larvae]|uniref:Lysine transporter LysE n=1 Tax=Acinetobacter larvae TaxID=1789224 RepID=A0A1B2LZW3_9GAMM|nr:LysE family translocator [Acinetobacter larvae]AOA58451.1 hypothetical protein BFG52_08850 [Acinetobacter larvae]
MTLFLLIAVTHFVALLSPGPDFFLILTTLLRQGRHAAAWVCLGIALGNAVVLLFIYLCMHDLQQLNPDVIQDIQYIAAAYMLYLAWRCIQATQQPPLQWQFEQPMAVRQSWKLLALGLQSSLFNPKNILFYSSLILMFYQELTGWQHASLSVWMVSVVLFWNLLLLRLLSLPQCMRYLQQYAVYLHALAALCFTIFAGLMLCS